MISVIVPAYNAEKYIKKCIKSILNQTYSNFEIIIVNDGSTDNTLNIINEFNDKRIRIINQKNGGVSNAKNAALDIIKGDYVTFVDSDDTIPKDALEILINLMTDDVDFVSGNYNEVKFIAKPHKIASNSFKNYEDAKKRIQEFDKYMWWQAGRLYKSDIIKNFHLRFDQSISLGEDHIFNLNYAQHTSEKIIFTNKIVYNYYYIRNGLTTRFYKDMNRIQRKIYNVICQLFCFDKINTDFTNDYISTNLNFLVEYYYVRYSLEEAIQLVEDTFKNVYADVINDAILEKSFTNKQIQYIKENNYTAFTKDYIKIFPQKTIWRKFKNNIKLFILK